MAIVEGCIAVKAVINSKYRDVHKIYIQDDKTSSDISFILLCAKKKKIMVERCNKEKIDALSIGKTHGGVLADVSERKTQSLISLLKKDKPFLFFLEGIEDSYNLGYIFRTLYAFGCDGVIMKERNDNYDDATMIKSSAGASEIIPIYYSDDINQTINVLKNNGIKIYSAYRGNNPKDLYICNLKNEGLLMCVGGPLRGLSKVILDNSDEYIFIPYASDFKNALNAASACAVIASEVYRQNRG